MILAFKQQFVLPIFDGTKIHTIREDSKDRWKRGVKIHFATGVRSKNYNNFLEGQCTGVQRIFMTYAYNDLIEISVNGRELSDFNAKMKFIKNDGFNSWKDFFDWFYPIIMSSPDQEFHGKIIHWTDFKY